MYSKHDLVSAMMKKDVFFIITFDETTTVVELVERYIAQKRGVRENTRGNYNFVLNILKKEAFGNMRIGNVKLSDAKLWRIRQQDDGRGYSTIHSVRGVVATRFRWCWTMI